MKWLPALTGFAASALSALPALADQEASNRAHVTAGPYGQCYARSVPAHLYDPEDQPRQQGQTEIFRVQPTTDVPAGSYDWFSQQLYLLCRPEGIFVVRIGPWQRGHTARDDHLALAFYRDGQLLRRYSTPEIAAGAPAGTGVSASVSHYTIFEGEPLLERIVTQEGAIFRETWVVRATTVDSRTLIFDPLTGEVR